VRERNQDSEREGWGEASQGALLFPQGKMCALLPKTPNYN
jgi:hypothetical protein